MKQKTPSRKLTERDILKQAYNILSQKEHTFLNVPHETYLSLLFSKAHAQMDPSLTEEYLKEIAHRCGLETSEHKNQFLSQIDRHLGLDIRFLEILFGLFLIKLKEAWRKPETYAKYTKWVVDAFGEYSKHILGNDWQRYRQSRERKPKRNRIIWDYIKGRKLKDLGLVSEIESLSSRGKVYKISDPSKSHLVYSRYKPKALIQMAAAIFPIVRPKDFFAVETEKRTIKVSETKKKVLKELKRIALWDAFAVLEEVKKELLTGNWRA